MWCGGVDERRSSLRRQPLPLAALCMVTGHVRELQLLLAHFWDVVFWVIRRGFQQEVFFITEQDMAEQSSPKEV